MASVSFYHGARVVQAGEEPGLFESVQTEASAPIETPLDGPLLDFSQAARSGLLLLVEDN